MRRLLTLLIVATAVEAAGEETFRVGTVVERVASNTDPEISYSYYLPKAYTTDRRWPVLFVFDPRQRGAFAANLFSGASEEFGWIIVSSNDTRSDGPLEPNIRAVNEMWSDVHQRFSIDRKRIYATGFSGGAILAWWLAESTRVVAGVISVGGRVNGPERIRDVPFDWFGIAGDTDFNYIETREIDDRLASIDASRRLATFEGGHRWAPKELLRKPIEWMEIQAMRRGLRAPDAALISSALQDDLALARNAADDLQSLRMHETIVRSFAGLTDTTASEAQIAALQKAQSVSRAEADERRALELERSHRKRLPQALRRLIDAEDAPAVPALAHDLHIPRLQKLAKEKTYEGAAARRVLETIHVQLNFYLAQQLTGQKLVAARAVAEMIRPSR